LASAGYEIVAEKQEVGRAEKAIELTPDYGMRVELLLRPEPAPKMFVKVPLENGFGIRGNPKYAGSLRAVRVRMAYAAWGGSKSFADADFTLDDESLTVSFSGVQETDRKQLIAAPNVLKFTPALREFVTLHPPAINFASSALVR
jgi:hypothetical protein